MIDANYRSYLLGVIQHKAKLNGINVEIEKLWTALERISLEDYKRYKLLLLEGKIELILKELNLT